MSNLLKLESDTGMKKEPKPHWVRERFFHSYWAGYAILGGVTKASMSLTSVKGDYLWRSYAGHMIIKGRTKTLKEAKIFVEREYLARLKRG